MAHLKGDQSLIHSVAQEDTRISFTNLVRAAFRDAKFFACPVQPVVEPLCPDTALLIHKNTYRIMPSIFLVEKKY